MYVISPVAPITQQHRRSTSNPGVASLTRHIRRVAHGASRHPWHQLLPQPELHAQELTHYAIHRQGSVPPPSIAQQGRKLAVRRQQGAHRGDSLTPHASASPTATPTPPARSQPTAPHAH
jgi:hypothetical protein